MSEYIETVDLILTPSLTTLPPKLGELSHEQGFEEYRIKVSQYATFLAIANASGQPAACLPLFWTEDNFPVASQIIGKFGAENLILRLSAELEKQADWKHYLSL